MNNIDMVFGAPGCGKTTYLINCLEKLLDTNDPNKIAFVSFTKKGSYEGRDRAIQQFNYKEKDFPFFRTIHSLAFRDLGVSKYEIISKRHYKEFSKAMGMNFLGYYTEDLINNDDKYLFHVSLEKNNPVMAEKQIDNLMFQKFIGVRNNYERYKKEMGIIDFDDLLINFIKQDRALPVDIAIIDEAQDLTSLQWEFCEVAFRNCNKVIVAGDDDQAIYEWSGADINHFLKMVSKTEKSSVYILDKSYRLKENILNLSKKISCQIHGRVEKDFAPIDTGGNVFFHNDLTDVPINSEESYYFLARNNYFLKEYKDYLMKKGIVFFHKNKYSVDKAKFNSIRKYEQFRKNKKDLGVNVAKNIKSDQLRKDKKVGDVWYNIFDMELEESNYYRDLFRDKVDINKCDTMINTIHGVKGGEADNVVFKLDVTRNVHGSLMENLNAELRCLYVALTRTKKNLHIIYSKSKFGYDKIIQEVL